MHDASLRIRARDDETLALIVAALAAYGLAVGDLVGPLPARRTGRRAGWFLGVDRAAAAPELGGTQ